MMKRVFVHCNKPKSHTTLFSVRIDTDVLHECRSRGVNISLAINMFLKKYLYIQKYDDSSILFGKDSFVLDDVAIDVYDRRKVLY